MNFFKTSSKNVIPAKAGIHKMLKLLDSRFHGSDKWGIIRDCLKRISLSLLLTVMITPISMAQECLQVSPSFGFQGSDNYTVQVDSAGTHFQQGITQVSFANPGIEVVNINVADNETLTVKINIAGNAPLGSDSISVTTGTEEIVCSDFEGGSGFDVRQWVALGISNGLGLPGSQNNQVLLNLENLYGPVKVIQADICDAGNYLTLSADDNFLTTDRTEGFFCSIQEISNGCLRIFMMGSYGNIGPGEGPILVLKYDVSEESPQGQCSNLSLKNVKVSDDIFNQLKVTKVPGEFCYTSGIDSDNDSIFDEVDNCTDTDGDGYGNPGFVNNNCPIDNCPFYSNPDQMNSDNDSYGNVCDDDDDNDGIPDDGDGSGIEGDNPCGDTNTDVCDDNCRFIVNPDQLDSDNDTYGDACDRCPDDPEKAEPGNCGCGNIEEPDCGSNTTTTTVAPVQPPGGGGGGASHPSFPECADDSDCDNGIFCDGSEKCEQGECLAGESPCADNETCDEDEDECFIPEPVPDPECLFDEDCDDGIFCNGEEQCDNGECADGYVPCGLDQICMEHEHECWDVQKISALSVKKSLLRPVILKKRCTWLALDSAGDNNFDRSESIITIRGKDSGCTGVKVDSEKEPFKAFGYILVPICIEKKATAGLWEMVIETRVTDTADPFEERIAADFEIK